MGYGNEIQLNVDAEHFRAYLEMRGISLRKLCSDVGISRSYLYKRLDEGKLSLSIAIDICMYLDATARMVFGPQIDLAATYDLARKLQRITFREG